MWSRELQVIVVVLVFALLLPACETEQRSEEGEPYRSWEEIVSSDTLRVATMTSPTDFYIFRGEPFGMEYYKARDFAKNHGLYLDIHLTNQMDSLLVWLDEGKVDLCITPLPMTTSNRESYTFCGIMDTLSFVLVQRTDVEHKVHSLSELSDKVIHVEKKSAGELRLEQIRSEIGADDAMQIHAVDTISSEDLLFQLLSSDRDSLLNYVVADERLARLFDKHFHNLDYSMQLSVPIRYAWAVVDGNEELATVVNDFFGSEGRAKHYKEMEATDASIYYYFRQYTSATSLHDVRLKDGLISPYDHVFQEEAKRLGWHWTFLAAIAYQESRFQPDVVAWSGARGLMGIMPATGRGYGAALEELIIPDVSVRVAVDFLLDLTRHFKEYEPMEERVSFVLASYNAGLGHVRDAQRLAEKYGAPTREWSRGVREYVLLKSTPAYYNDPVVKFGYVRGRETVNYVDEVLERQMAYRALVR